MKKIKHIPLRKVLREYCAHGYMYTPKFNKEHLKEAGIEITQKIVDYCNTNYTGWVKAEGEFTMENAGERLASMLLQDKYRMDVSRIKMNKGKEPYILPADSQHKYVEYDKWYIPWRNILMWMLDEGKDLKDNDWNEDIVEVIIKWKE